MAFRSVASRVGFPGYQEIYKVCPFVHMEIFFDILANNVLDNHHIYNISCQSIFFALCIVTNIICYNSY